MVRVRRSWRPHQLRAKSRRRLSPGRHLHRQDPQRREAGGSAGPATDKIRAGHQCGDRQGARAHHPARPPRPRRPGDRMRRRDALLWLALAAAPISPARAQAPGKIYRLGVLASGSQTLRAPHIVVLPELARHGFVEGQNLVLEARTGAAEDMPALARELVETLPDIVLAVGLPAALAARAATRTIPIIAVSSFPIEAGLVASLARPGGNLSGVSIFTAELNLKRLAILHEVVPAARRMALLRDPALAPPEHMAALAAAARDLGISLDVIEVRQPDEI